MPTAPLTFMFKDDGEVPNNAVLPTLIYKGALDLSDGTDPAVEIERRFAANDWGYGQWRNGIYPFVHYHSMTHEALGIARGQAKVRLGGDKGKVFDFQAGDVAVLPAGTGHQRLSASRDLLVVGGYPSDGSYDLCRADNPGDRNKALQTIPRVPVPASDPVLGPSHGLPELWTR